MFVRGQKTLVRPKKFLIGRTSHPSIIRLMLRRLHVLIPCAVAAFLAWIFIPGTAIDRALFSLTARSFANPPFFITGNGTHSRPHTLRTLKSAPGENPEETPTIISLGDDPDGFFQSSPPSPVDFAVILKNFARLGETGPAIAIPLAWQETDAISLAALDLQFDSLPSVITTAPLTRNANPSPIPPAFRRASVPLSSITGDPTLLPIVNHIPIPDIVLGNKTSLAGFSFIESEPPPTTPRMLARWEDSVVFSFPLLTAMRHFQVSPEALEIRLGEFISLGADGPFIPIDRYGKLTYAPVPIAPDTLISAPSLIDAPDDLLSGNKVPPAILRNDLSSADPRSRDFSKSLAGTVASLTAPDSTSASKSYARLHPAIELSLLLALVILFTVFARHPLGSRPTASLLYAFVLAAIHFIIVPLTGSWIPTFPAFAALGTFTIVATMPVGSPEKRANIPHSSAADPVPEKPPVKKTAAKKAVKKAAAKKTAGKSARKKTKKTARKTAKKTARKNASKTSPPKPTGK